MKSFQALWVMGVWMSNCSFSKEIVSNLKNSKALKLLGLPFFFKLSKILTSLF